MYQTFIIGGIVLLSYTASPLAFAASFDCNKAHSLVEYAICTNAELSSSDDQVAARYKEMIGAVADTDAVRADQRKWLAKRNDCKDIDCLREIYTTRLSELVSYATQAKKEAPTGPQILGTDQPEWPFTLEELRDTYVNNELYRWAVLWRDGWVIPHVTYRQGPEYKEVQQKVTGRDLFNASLIRVQSFEVTSGKRGVNAKGITYDYTYRAEIVATDAFEVVPVRGYNNTWEPQIVKGKNTSLNYAAFVEKGTVLELTGKSFLLYTGPPQPPQEPNSQQQGSATWWKK